jgi:NAD(P)-dependent dehydrogenase (short-subunit alcohol dehydrogenase family)
VGKARLAGKRAIVTGAASGIGRASAILFAVEGARVLAVDREEKGLQETLAALRDAGGEGIAETADVGSEAAVESFVGRCIAEFGGLEVMFANAGIGGGGGAFLEQSAKQWEDVLRVNLIGAFLCAQQAARHMVAHGGGSIVCTASVAALRAHGGRSHYSASKAGVVSLAQTAANELAGTGVRVNAICPGLAETGMTRGWFVQARAQGREHRMGRLTPARRAGTVDEMAQLALFLASDDSSYVNGQAIAVDGGLSSTHPYTPNPDS